MCDKKCKDKSSQSSLNMGEVICKKIQDKEIKDEEISRLYALYLKEKELDNPKKYCIKLNWAFSLSIIAVFLTILLAIVMVVFKLKNF